MHLTKFNQADLLNIQAVWALLQPNHPSKLHNLVCHNVVIIILFVDDVVVEDVVVLVTCCTLLSRVEVSAICLSLTMAPDIIPCNSDCPIFYY